MEVRFFTAVNESITMPGTSHSQHSHCHHVVKLLLLQDMDAAWLKPLIFGAECVGKEDENPSCNQADPSDEPMMTFENAEIVIR